MKFFKGWDGAYREHIDAIEHNPNRERNTIVCMVLNDAVANTEKWGLTAWDARGLTELLEQYQRGDRDPAQVLAMFTASPFNESRFERLHGAFRDIITNNMTTGAVCETYTCAMPE